MDSSEEKLVLRDITPEEPGWYGRKAKVDIEAESETGPVDAVLITKGLTGEMKMHDIHLMEAVPLSEVRDSLWAPIPDFEIPEHMFWNIPEHW